MNSTTGVLALLGEPGREHSATVLTVDLVNQVDYQADISGPAQFATKTGVTPAATPKNIFVVTLIAEDRGGERNRYEGKLCGPDTADHFESQPAPGDAIADVTRTAMREHFFEILNTDGTAVGTIMSPGFSGGTAPPGLGPPANEKGNWVIVEGRVFIWAHAAKWAERAAAAAWLPWQRTWEKAR